MAAPQFNFYSDIHKGLRWWMYRFAHDVGVLDWQDEEAAQALTPALQKLMKFLRDHLHHEDEFVHPLVERRAPGQIAVLRAEHTEHEAAFDELDALFQEALSHPPDDPLRRRLGLQFYRAFNHMIGMSLLHIHREDTEVMRALWEGCTNDEVFDTYARLLKSLPPEEMEDSLRAMMPAVEINEQVALVEGARQIFPPEAMEGAVALTASVLSPEAMARLKARLGMA